MERLLIPATAFSPEINFDEISNILSISGESYPENASEFYQPVFDWLTIYCLKPNREIRLEINLNYYNTSSSKILLQIFEKLESYHQKKGTAAVTWFYPDNDEDLLESGREYSCDVELPFSFASCG